ncbi:MAG: acyl-CoA reductase [Gammaproteobacteria bacterium]|jgi:hypothetical protein|nr:acyl-CoA reductase [Gammaproteobacteria bacterium]
MKILLGKKSSDWQKDVVQLRQASLSVSSNIMPLAIEFLNALSQEIFKNPEYKKYPDLISLAFWLRKANLLALVKQHLVTSAPNTYLRPRGLVLHFTPSNVDTMFLYSWAIGLLTGNQNILRLSNRRGRVAEILLELCDYLLKNASEYASILNYNMFVEYEHNEHVTAYLSQHCDVRVIWGGDTSVQAIRHVPIPAHAVEAVFANRFSLCMIKADALVEVSQQDNRLSAIIEGFVNDAFWFDQQGCSSPRAIIWFGDEATVLQAQNYFWPAVRQLVEERFPDLLTTLSYPVQRFTFLAKVAAENKGRLLGKIDDFPLRIEAQSLDAGLRSEHPGLGCFYEMRIDSLTSVASLLQRKDQTLTSFGFSQSELNDIAMQACGIDRIVPFGKALAFSPLWDGYNLFHTMSRLVVVES